jgi:hypothetical protein
MPPTTNFDVAAVIAAALETAFDENRSLASKDVTNVTNATNAAGAPPGQTPQGILPLEEEPHTHLAELMAIKGTAAVLLIGTLVCILGLIRQLGRERRAAEEVPAKDLPPPTTCCGRWCLAHYVRCRLCCTPWTLIRLSFVWLVLVGIAATDYVLMGRWPPWDSSTEGGGGGSGSSGMEWDHHTHHGLDPSWSHYNATEGWEWG